jgi:beta-glucosidase
MPPMLIPQESLTGGQGPASPDATVELRVESILKQITLAEKIDLLSGLRGLPRAGVPPMTAVDGPFGIRNFARTTVTPGGIALAATWNTELTQRIGTQLGRDARSSGAHFALMPGVNIYRSPLAGRNFEYFGEDPYLAARLAVAFVEGLQSQGVAATIKHYLANNSEYARHTTDAVIDERTAREIYLPPFEAAVKEAGVGAVLDAYDLVNGEHMTQNRHWNVDVLKKEWGFRGVLMSDWHSTYDTLAAANGGLDLEMPTAERFNGADLEPLVRAAKVSVATIDDKVRRLLRTALRFGWFDRPQLDTSISRFNSAGRAVALQAATEAIVLLKNSNSILPFDAAAVRSIAVIGPDVYPAPLHGGGSATAVPFHAVSLLEGLSDKLGPDVQIDYSRGITDLRRLAAHTAFATAQRGGREGLQVEVFDNPQLAGRPVATRIDAHIAQGEPLDVTAFASGDREFDVSALRPPRQVAARWSGYYTPVQSGDHDLFVQLGSENTGHGFYTGYRLYVDDRLVCDHWSAKTALVAASRVSLDLRPHKVVLEHRAAIGGLGGPVPLVLLGIVRAGEWVEPAAERFAARADAVIVAVGFDSETEAEDSDRTYQLPPGQDELIHRICTINTRCVVIVTSGGAVDTSGWLENVPGLLQAWYLGQEGGTALASVLLGGANPSGHLPATFERRWEDNPTHDSYYPEPGSHRVRYSEGVFVGYRGYEARNIRPQFPFGYGLSYTKFEYTDLTLQRSTSSPAALFQATFTVKNTGPRAGAAVPQLYVAPPSGGVPRPPKELKGFVKLTLQPGESRRIVLPLDARSFAFYDVEARRWQAQAGTYQVLIGDSTEHIVLRGEVTLRSSIRMSP